MEKQREIEAFFKKKKQVQVAYLFGSQALGCAGPTSDYDFAILLKGNGKEDFLEKQIYFMKELSDLLHTTKVEVLILNEAPPRIAHQVLKYGKVVFQRNNRARVLFETKTENLYFDYQYFYQVGDKYLLKRLKEGTLGG